MIEIRLLSYFLAIAREQSITRAAESLHVSQPTLSKQMMELEEQLGKQLLIRGRKRVTLTEDGEYLRKSAQEIIALMEKTESSFQESARGVGGDIYLACGESAGMGFLAEVYQELLTDYPDIRLHIHSGDADTITERLDKGLADLGLFHGPSRTTNMISSRCPSGIPSDFSCPRTVRSQRRKSLTAGSCPAFR